MERTPDLSPDGRYVALEIFDTEADRWIGAIAEMDTRKILLRLEESAETGSWDWHPDGEAVALNVWKNGVDNVWLFPVDGSTPQQITDFTDDERIRFFAWLPDGKSLILSRGTDSRDVVLITNFR